MVECEYEHTPVLPKTFAVLIDTWWNVNNLFFISYKISGSSFNRYMVECEFETIEPNMLAIFRFNRYMVECEYFL